MTPLFNSSFKTKQGSRRLLPFSLGDFTEYFLCDIIKQINMPSMNPFSKGSEWRKWDLHIHSPLSILNNCYPKSPNGEPDWEKFVGKLGSLGVAVVGITDYFTIEGYKKLLEIKKDGKLPCNLTILPNIEFRLSSVLSSKKDGKDPRRLNFHVIFSDEVSWKDIEEHFLHDINFFYEGNPQEKDESRKLKISNLEALGKQLISQHAQFKGRPPLEVGAMCAVVNHGEISSILNGDSRFKGKHLIIFPEELSCLIDWDGQDHLIRKGILQKSDMVFSSSQNTRNWCLGKPPYQEGPFKFLEEFKTLKPCIHGSDAHSIEEIGNPCGKRGNVGHKCEKEPAECDLRYCWIKADPTFEGLKQLLYEPEDRIVIQKDDPTPSRSNLTIKQVKIKEGKINKELSISDTDQDLNIGLVAVAGGRGTGKTALVDLIANCYQDRVNTDDQNSFVKRISDQSPKLNVELVFKNDERFIKKITDGTFFEDGQISYIAQGELERYIGEGSDLNQYINKLIFQYPKIVDSLQKYEMSKTREKQKRIEIDIQQKSKNIKKLEDDTKTEEYKNLEIDKKRLLANLNDINSRIAEIEKLLSEDKIEIAKKKQKEIDDLKTKKELLISLKEQILLAANFLKEDLSEFNAIVDKINNLYSKIGETAHYVTLVYSDEPKLNTALEKSESEISLIIDKISKIQEEINKYESGIKIHTLLLGKKKVVEDSLRNAENKKEELESKKIKLGTETIERKKLFKDLIKTTIDIKNKYDEIISIYATNKAQILSDLEFVAEIVFNSERFLKRAEDIVDNRRVVVRSDDISSPFHKMVSLYNKIASGENENIDELADQIDAINKELKSKIKQSTIVSTEELYNLVYGNYLSVVPFVKYKSTRINKLSLGQKATVLIKIYLAEGENPIIIDSHDEHLDNAFIMDELMGSIREAKKYRQVILVSNNGNVVINSDAEQIILANRAGTGEISYTAGSIENPIIRDIAVKVLEGGSEAFKKRQQKYRIYN
jgi:hypothetical protein